MNLTITKKINSRAYGEWELMLDYGNRSVRVFINDLDFFDIQLDSQYGVKKITIPNDLIVDLDVLSWILKRIKKELKNK
jgi:hypothetical protein